MTKYYELTHKGRTFYTVYTEADIIKRFCDMVHGHGINPDEIETKTYINGREATGCTHNNK